MKSLLLDRTEWDLVLDSFGNIAVCSEPYARAQDVANACRLFSNELYYDIEKGIPYDVNTLGHWPPMSLVKAQMEAAALTVPDVVSAKVIVDSAPNRRLGGQVQFIDVDGKLNGATF